MELDTLRFAIAMASLSLVVALLIGWMQVKQERFLIIGAIGTCCIVFSVSLMGFHGRSFEASQKLLPYSLVLAGLSCIYASTRLFGNDRATLARPMTIGLISIALTISPLAFGLTGVTAMMLNLCCGIILLMCAYETWTARFEALSPLIANTMIYILVAVSYLCCAAFFLKDQTWVITTIPNNWAETFNAFMALIGVTSLGTITLTLHYARSARLHQAQANTDALTGVLNRRAIFDRFENDRSMAGDAVIMFDLDHFKQINDHFGHAHGDLVLSRFAAVLREYLRPEDVISRIGGEEFCVVLPNQDQDSAQRVADRIRRVYEELRIISDNKGFAATVSAGVAICEPGERFASAMRRADAALYQAKRSGRNTVQTALKDVA